MFGANYFGSLVLGAGLVVTALTPVPPAHTAGNGYATAVYGSGVFGASGVSTSQTPVPPTPTRQSVGGYGTCVYGTGVFGAGGVVTSQTPVPPTPATTRVSGYFSTDRRQQVHAATVALVQSPARLAALGHVSTPHLTFAGNRQSASVISASGSVIRRELTEAGEEELLLALLTE